MRLKMTPVIYAQEGMSEINECKLNAENRLGDNGATYGLIALSKSSDGKTADCMIAVYTIKFNLAGKKVERDNSLLWGFYKWTSVEENEMEKFLTKDEIEKFQNFFRYKALTAFKRDGKIDNINYREHEALN